MKSTIALHEQLVSSPKEYSQKFYSRILRSDIQTFTLCCIPLSNITYNFHVCKLTAPVTQKLFTDPYHYHNYCYHKPLAKFKLTELKRRNTNACLYDTHKNHTGDLKTMSCAIVCFKLDISLRNLQASWCFEYNLSFPCLLTAPVF